MSNSISLIILGLIFTYLMIGVAFYLPFIKIGVNKIDEGVKEAPLLMKVLIFPGVVALWPLLWQKLKKAKGS